jgi:hypothetical protein
MKMILCGMLAALLMVLVLDPTPAREEQPTLWSVREGDTVIYLVGTERAAGTGLIFVPQSAARRSNVFRACSISARWLDAQSPRWMIGSRIEWPRAVSS